MPTFDDVVNAASSALGIDDGSGGGNGTVYQNLRNLGVPPNIAAAAAATQQPAQNAAALHPIIAPALMAALPLVQFPSQPTTRPLIMSPAARTAVANMRPAATPRDAQIQSTVSGASEIALIGGAILVGILGAAAIGHFVSESKAKRHAKRSVDAAA
jgi:hypothetical protein